MPALIAGNTLSDLSRNSLAQDAAQQSAYENAMNRARRAYEYNNLSAQDRERTNQLMADNALRRELGLGDIGVRREAVGAQRDVGMADVGVRGRAVGVQEKLGVGGLANDAERIRQLGESIRSGERLGMAGIGAGLTGQLAPYLYGETEAQHNDRMLREMAVRNQFDLGKLGVEVDRERVGAGRDIGMAGIGANMVINRYPWDLGMTPAQEAQNRLNQTALSNQLAIGTMPYVKPTAGEALNYNLGSRQLDILGKQWELGGPQQIELARAASIASNEANSILESNKEQAFTKLVSDIKPWYGGLSGASVKAREVQSAIDNGGDPYSLGLSRNELNAAINYKNSLNAARGAIAASLGDRYGTIGYDSRSGRFVPLYTVGSRQSERTQQLAPSAQADITVERGGKMWRNKPDGSREPFTFESAPAPRTSVQPQSTQQPGFFGNVSKASNAFWNGVSSSPVSFGFGAPTQGFGFVREAASRLLPPAGAVESYMLGERPRYSMVSEAPLPPAEPTQYQRPPDFGLPPIEPTDNWTPNTGSGSGYFPPQMNQWYPQDTRPLSRFMPPQG